MSHAQVYGPTLRRIENLLKRLEWCDDSAWCPECGVYRWDTKAPPPHESGCELKLLIEAIQECA